MSEADTATPGDAIRSLVAATRATTKAQRERDEAQAAADRLATALALVIYDAHPTYANTTKWGGGIGGQAMTSHCSLTQGAPPGDDWAEFDLPSKALREWLQGRDGFDLNASKEAMKVELLAMLERPKP